mmetsp:Transcript_8394/g.18814  ORF Transcript_8394/g.18814 Transcript_8394/m.18814 type:complete len:198 (-) Transcript_8394:372-965(-)
MTDGPLGCRRRRKRQRPSSINIDALAGTQDTPQQPAMAPRSFEHQIYITMARTGHRMAFLSRGLISCFVSHLDGISNFCAFYSFTGVLFTAYVGLMIKHQPLYIKGIDASNQELTKESAFGAMGMFLFLFTSSVLYLCFHKHHDEEHSIRAQGYMRPQMQAGGMRMSDYQVELPRSVSSPQNSDSEDDDEFAPVLLS